MKTLLITALMLLPLVGISQTDTLKNCLGTVQSGKGCKSTFLVDSTQYCQWHSPNSIRCGAQTSKNKPCRILVKVDGVRCRFHVGDPVMK